MSAEIRDDRLCVRIALDLLRAVRLTCDVVGDALGGDGRLHRHGQVDSVRFDVKVTNPSEFPCVPCQERLARLKGNRGDQGIHDADSPTLGRQGAVESAAAVCRLSGQGVGRYGTQKAVYRNPLLGRVGELLCAGGELESSDGGDRESNVPAFQFTRLGDCRRMPRAAGVNQVDQEIRVGDQPLIPREVFFTRRSASTRSSRMASAIFSPLRGLKIPANSKREGPPIFLLMTSENDSPPRLSRASLR